jgi:hypothetical protein
MPTARDATSAIVASNIPASIIINSFAHTVSGNVSVGENAVAFVTARIGSRVTIQHRVVCVPWAAAGPGSEQNSRVDATAAEPSIPREDTDFFDRVADIAPERRYIR